MQKAGGCVLVDRKWDNKKRGKTKRICTYATTIERDLIGFRYMTTNTFDS